MEKTTKFSIEKCHGSFLVNNEPGLCKEKYFRNEKITIRVIKLRNVENLRVKTILSGI